MGDGLLARRRLFPCLLNWCDALGPLCRGPTLIVRYRDDPQRQARLGQDREQRLQGRVALEAERLGERLPLDSRLARKAAHAAAGAGAGAEGVGEVGGGPLAMAATVALSGVLKPSDMAHLGRRSSYRQIMLRLKTDEQIGRVVQRPLDLESKRFRDSSLAVEHVRQARPRNADGVGQSGGSDTPSRKNMVLEDQAGVNGKSIAKNLIFIIPPIALLLNVGHDHLQSQDIIPTVPKLLMRIFQP